MIQMIDNRILKKQIRNLENGEFYLLKNKLYVYFDKKHYCISDEFIGVVGIEDSFEYVEPVDIEIVLKNKKEEDYGGFPINGVKFIS